VAEIEKYSARCSLLSRFGLDAGGNGAACNDDEWVDLTKPDVADALGAALCCVSPNSAVLSEEADQGRAAQVSSPGGHGCPWRPYACSSRVRGSNGMEVQTAVTLSACPHLPAGTPRRRLRPEPPGLAHPALRIRVVRHGHGDALPGPGNGRRDPALPLRQDEGASKRVVRRWTRRLAFARGGAPCC